MMTGHVLKIISMMIVVAAFVSGCHGDNAASSGGSDWEQLTWDQDNWS